MKLHHLFIFIIAALSLSAAASVSDLAGPGAAKATAASGQKRCSDRFKITAVPAVFANATMITIERGDSAQKSPGFSFKISGDATVYLLVHDRGTANVPAGWTKTPMKVEWTTDDGSMNLTDTVYKKTFPAGLVTIPPHDGRDEGGAFGVPNAAVVTASDGTPAAAGATDTPKGPVSISGLPENLQAKVMPCVKGSTRLSSGFTLVTIPPALANGQLVGIVRGERTAAAPAWKFSISKAATVYLLVHDRGTPALPSGWTQTSMKVEWTTGDATLTDTVYVRDFSAGTVDIPGHSGMDGETYGIPNSCVIVSK
ncbi:MAG: hypothetical protein HZC28_05715 [Spirochaetes bacterium]|nr:hypothetical protein [Spirochaetota bacterium]